MYLSVGLAARVPSAVTISTCTLHASKITASQPIRLVLRVYDEAVCTCRTIRHCKPKSEVGRAHRLIREHDCSISRSQARDDDLKYLRGLRSLLESQTQNLCSALLIDSSGRISTLD